jgi:hypothetical protein
VPFDFDHGGSQIIFYSPDQDYAALDALRQQAGTRAPSDKETRDARQNRKPAAPSFQ